MLVSIQLIYSVAAMVSVLSSMVGLCVFLTGGVNVTRFLGEGVNSLLAGLALLNVTATVAMYRPRPVFLPFRLLFPLFAISLLGTELGWIFWVLQLLLLALLADYDTLIGVGTMALLVLTWPALLWRHWQGWSQTASAVEESLRQGLGARYLDQIPENVQTCFRPAVRFTDWVNPFGFRRSGVEKIADISYQPGGERQRLDIYRPKDIPEQGCPVLLQIHGGGWMYGHKAQQALPLIYHMAANGWVVVAPNYRLSPSIAFPTQLHDCKAALCWIRENGKNYGMNPDFVAVTGGSAGGHLAALLGLTENLPELQAHNPTVDTSVQACVPFYGEYDLQTAHTYQLETDKLVRMYTDKIMHVSQEDNPDLWHLASPITQVHDKAPPFMVVHGSMDSFIPVTRGREFAQALNRVSSSAVVYLEVPGAEHGFDIVRSVRSETVIDGVHRFLEWAKAKHGADNPPSRVPPAPENS